MTPRGMYERTRAYERLDVVTYQGSSWVAIVDVPAQISPAMGSDYWQLVARMGETGPQGPVGPQGNSAFDGTGVELVNNLTQGGQTAALSAEQGKILKQELTELESEDIQTLYDVFKTTTETDSRIARLDNYYINTQGVKTAVSSTDAEWYVLVYKTEDGVEYNVKGTLIVNTMAVAVYADAECTQLIKVIHNNGVKIDTKYIGDGNYLAVSCWYQGTATYIPVVTKINVEKDTLNPSIKVPYIDSELLGYTKNSEVTFNSQQVKTAFINLDIKKGNRFLLRFDSQSSWQELGVFYGKEWSDASRVLVRAALKGQTYEFVAKEDITDIKVFLISASNYNISISAILEGVGRVEILEKHTDGLLEDVAYLKDVVLDVADEVINANLDYTSQAVQTAFSSLGIKAGENFRLSFASESTWSQVGVFYGANWSEHTKVLIDSAVNGKTYEFTAKEDINDIKVFLISAPTFNMTISAKYEKSGRLSEVEKAVEDIVTSRSAILPYLSNKADALVAGSSLAISSAPNTKNHHVIGCNMAITEMGRIRISHGLDTYAFGMVEIDDTNVYEYITGNTATPAYTNPHGLEISDFLNVAVRIGTSVARAELVITSLAGSVSKTINWMGCTGQAILTAVSGSYNNVELSMGGNAYKKDVWFFGDSYADYWPPVLYQKNVTDFHLDAFSGRNSAAALTSLQNALKLGTPKVLVWMLGMNDGDGSAINTSYKSVFDSVKSICKNMGIAFVPCTIPNCPVVNNYHKNAYVRANAEHYIDMAKILGADYTDSTWYDGLIAADNVHPSEKGKVVIANAILASGVL